MAPDQLLMKRTVAIVGASADRQKFGNKSVRAHRDAGWKVFPIHPNAAEIEGMPTFARLTDVPVPVFRISLYLPQNLGMGVLAEIAALDPAEFFVNPGAANSELLAEAGRLGLTPILACSILDVGGDPTA